MNTETLRIHLMNTANKAKTPSEIVEAIKMLPAGNESRISDFIVALCWEKGIDPQADELREYYRQTEEYKAAQGMQEKQAALRHAFTDIETVTKEYRDNEARGAIPNQEQIDTITERMKKQIANIGAAQGECRIYTAMDYLTDCLNYDPSRDFSPALFGHLAFPDGTTSYIGARTSRGKTTAMVNLARETLTGKRRKTIFITLEMSGKQILNQIILSAAFSRGIKEAPDNRKAFMSMEPRWDIYTVWKNGDLLGNEANIFQRYVKDAHSAITQAQNDGRFILYDGRGATEPEIINFMEANAEKGTVILLDYIQKMPPKMGNDTDSFRRVQAISYDVVNAAAKTNAVVIAGAQFNRMGGSDALGDIFTDQSFREAGDIEQDAHNAIGIGWTIDRQNRFYEVLKTREDKKQGLLYSLDFEGGYSYMIHDEQIYRPIGEKRPSKKAAREQKRSNL